MVTTMKFHYCLLWLFLLLLSLLSGRRGYLCLLYVKVERLVPIEVLLFNFFDCKFTFNRNWLLFIMVVSTDFLGDFFRLFATSCCCGFYLPILNWSALVSLLASLNQVIFNLLSVILCSKIQNECIVGREI
jgi:hypothetical protein